MYSIGDKVVYPMQGAGTIEKIEEKEILGELQQYYVLKLPYDGMTVMVPVGKEASVGIRSVVSGEHMDKVMELLQGKSTEMPSNWNHRHRENTDKLKSGDAYQVAEVVRNLGRFEKEKKLSTGEKKLLTNARRILVSEMVLVSGISAEEAEEIIEKALVV